MEPLHRQASLTIAMYFLCCSIVLLQRPNILLVYYISLVDLGTIFHEKKTNHKTPKHHQLNFYITSKSICLTDL